MLRIGSETHYPATSILTLTYEENMSNLPKLYSTISKSAKNGEDSELRPTLFTRTLYTSSVFAFLGTFTDTTSLFGRRIFKSILLSEVCKRKKTDLTLHMHLSPKALTKKVPLKVKQIIALPGRHQ